ncbi:hypothetical protein EG68_05151 [Paragonimus skrjabini miyazakii]|uniref:C2 domain-containing protein n=1 Tax=Paragonimus skrjabini miyazakii TaxID=59628 RepID=A0A8S9YAN5_9TREM|nr:hypothetical protein EG68_05151 [Paragonimus skrjabini miyazakii]
MLDMSIPKGVSIIVKCAENLEYSVPGSKKSAKTRKWCVVFIGGKKKMVTDMIDAQDGCPVWNSEVSIDLVTPVDPVVMLVLDGERRHIGQVVIPLAQVPRTGPPNFDASRLHYSELEPTKKNSTPRGRLVYWIWATSYWPPGTKLEAKSKSIKGSLSHLGRSKSKLQTSYGAPSIGGGLDDRNSTFSSDDRYSRAPSMVSGAYSESNLSGQTSFMGTSNPSQSMGAGNGLGLSPSTGGWNNSVGNVGGAPLFHGSQLGGTGSSYNPLAGCDDDGSVTGIPRLRSDASSNAGAFGRPPIYQSSLQLRQSQGDLYAESIGDAGAGKHKGLLKKMKHRFSKSTQNLTKSAAKKAGGDKIYGDTRGSLSRDSYLPDGSTRTVGAEEFGNVASNSPFQSRKPDQSGPQLRTEASTESANRLFGSPQTNNVGSWGLHAEERPKKPLEEMSHREIMNYAMQLERSSQVSRAEVVRVQSERDELVKKVESTEKDLDKVRCALADLRFRLLTAGLTDFLELPPSPGKTASLQLGTSSNDLYDDGWHTKSTGGMETSRGSHSVIGEAPQPTFLDKLTALTAHTRKLGGAPTAASHEEPPMPVAPTPVTDWW